MKARQEGNVVPPARGFEAGEVFSAVVAVLRPPAKTDHIAAVIGVWLVYGDFQCCFRAG